MYQGEILPNHSSILLAQCHLHQQSMVRNSYSIVHVCTVSFTPSFYIIGLKGRSKRSRLSDSHGFMYTPTPAEIVLSDSIGFCVNGTSRCMYGGAGVAGEGGSESVGSIDREIEEVFGPNQGGSESESSSMVGQCEEEDSGSVRSAASIEIVSCSEEERELISEVGEMAVRQKALGTVWELEEKKDSEQLESCPSNTPHSHDGLTPSHHPHLSLCQKSRC